MTYLSMHMARTKVLLAVLVASLIMPSFAGADGCFVWKWNKGADIHEPSQKAIILYDRGREDLILQVKYQGSVTDFGWLIPVPGKPEVTKASMDSFYELSRIVQMRMADRVDGRKGQAKGVEVLEYKTVGVYEIATLTATDAKALKKWLKDNEFNWPEKGDQVVQAYVGKDWYFVAAKISVDKAQESGVHTKLHTGELHPLKISFDTKTCVYPLAISSLNRNDTLIHIYMISRDRPWICSNMDFLTSQGAPFSNRFGNTAITFEEKSPILKDLPRLSDKQWHLFKHSQLFTPNKMHDLTFVPANEKNLTNACEKYLGHWVATHDLSRPKRITREAGYYAVVAAYYAPKAFETIAETLIKNSTPNQLGWVARIDWEVAATEPDIISSLLAHKWLAAIGGSNYDHRIQYGHILSGMKHHAVTGVRLLVDEAANYNKQTRCLHRSFDTSLGNMLRHCPDEQSIAKLIKLFRDVHEPSAPEPAYTNTKSHLITALAQTHSTAAADVLIEYLEAAPVLIAKALVNTGNKRSPDALAKALLIRGWAKGSHLLPILSKLDRNAAFECIIKAIDAEPKDGVVGGEDLGNFVRKGLTEKQERALSERAFKLHRSYNTDPVFRKRIEHLYEESLKEKDPEKVQALLKTAVRARNYLTKGKDMEPGDALIAKMALRAYE